MNSVEKELSEYLEGCKTAVISAHVNPDGDAVGAVFSVALMLKNSGVEPSIILDSIPHKYSFLKGGEYLYTGDTDELFADIFISLDCACKDRLCERALRVFDRTPKTLNIDHHISNTYFADVNYVYPELSSTCELLYHLVVDRNLIDKDTASALYTGIMYDTAGFRHASTTSETLKAAAALTEKHIPFSVIYRSVLLEHSAAEAKILGAAINNMKILNGGKYISSSLSQTEMELCGCGINDLDGIVEYLINVRGATVAGLFSERGDGKVKISLRSVGLDVSKICGAFGGGGHVNAAGATVIASLSEAEAMIAEEITGKIR